MEEEIVQAMERGGNQLRHILECHVPLQSLISSKYYFRLMEYDLLSIQTWLECAGDLKRALLVLEKQHGLKRSVRSMSEVFVSTLMKIRPRIKVTPQLNEQGEVINPFAFLNYEVYDIEETPYRIVETSLDMNKHWQVKANDADIEKYERLFIFKQIKGQWKEDGGSQFAKNHRKTYLKMKEWMKGSETTK